MKTKKNLLKNFEELELTIEKMSNIRGGDGPPPPGDPNDEDGK